MPLLRCSALDAAERHLEDLAHDRVRPCDKPNAFHHGLLLALVAELKSTKASFSMPDESAPTLSHVGLHEEQLDWVGTQS